VVVEVSLGSVYWLSGSSSQADTVVLDDTLRRTGDEPVAHLRAHVYSHTQYLDRHSCLVFPGSAGISSNDLMGDPEIVKRILKLHLQQSGTLRS
jgi:hypothetical protein